jgi:hypothetical protein
MAKKKEKKREPYRKSHKWGKKGAIPFLIPLLFVAITIILLIILINNPTIKIGDFEWRLVPLKISKTISFWLIFTEFVLLQVAIVWAYWQIMTKAFSYGKQLFAKVKNWTMNIKRYIITHHG